jgi:GNAT superfamily N-acetyltransferase
VLIRSLDAADVPTLRVLATEAEAEGFAFLTRFLADLARDRVRLDAPTEFFLGALLDGRIVAVGGVTRDPYTDDATVGRLRHLYVRAGARRQGVGRALVRSLEARARGGYGRLRLRAGTAAAARFYDALGYRRVSESAATHARPLVPADERAT